MLPHLLDRVRSCGLQVLHPQGIWVAVAVQGIQVGLHGSGRVRCSLGEREAGVCCAGGGGEEADGPVVGFNVATMQGVAHDERAGLPSSRRKFAASFEVWLKGVGQRPASQQGHRAGLHCLCEVPADSIMDTGQRHSIFFCWP